MVGVLQSWDFPAGHYAPDVREIASSTIERFGADEWKAVLLTNEIHGHLGIYSTIGAKMGLWARELLGAPLSVLSFAGSEPPVSCFNDGLQIGSRATLGHGQIKVADTVTPSVKAVFTAADGQSITLRLKNQYAKQIEEDIQTGVKLYGNSPAYWQYVRELAIKYWRDWDRKQIFEQ